MKVSELRELLKNVDPSLEVASEDVDGIICKIESAGFVIDPWGRGQYFLIAIDAGVSLFDEASGIEIVVAADT